MKEEKNRCLNTQLGILTEQMLACLSTESDLHKNYEQRATAAAGCMSSDKKQTVVGDQEGTCQLGWEALHRQIWKTAYTSKCEMLSEQCVYLKYKCKV